jgi:asparagine synthase (glutamine-hydrolysing)
MCGVAGFYSKKFSAGDHLPKMTNALYHRGPNDGGLWQSANGNIGIGQRRLSIIDLSENGHQPMVADGHILSFNGEIYNFKEIRTKLEKLGHSFFSKSDTEVVLKSLIQWGIEAVHEFNGMWSFVYYNIHQNKLIASRDRSGIKPLYYFWDNQTLLIASEIKGILASGLVKGAVDLEGLNEYFTFQNIISDRTLFSNIRSLPAGTNLEFRITENQFSLKKYWDYNFAPDLKLTENDAIDLFLTEFEKSVERHLISDVEVGATISGGMDSSAIVSVASKKINNLNTFTGYFNTEGNHASDRSFSERFDAKLVSETFKTKHFERLVSWQDQIDTMPMIVWHLEDPKVGMCYTFYNISQLVSSMVTVNLSGTGGDEIFAGYPWRYNLIENLTSANEFNSTYFNYWSRVIKEDEKNTFFTKKVLNNIDFKLPRKEFEKIVSVSEGLSPVNKALYFEAKTFLNGMLMVEDKLGMAFSIETRFPFLDKNLVELAQKIPDHLKYKNGEGKYIFRKAFEKLLPNEIVTKKKQGFTPPDFTWYGRELNQWVRSMLLGRRTLCHEYIEKSAIERIIQQHEKGIDMRFQIWSLLFFEGWCRTFLANEAEPSLKLW